jgi:hypothetical protein
MGTNVGQPPKVYAATEYRGAHATPRRAKRAGSDCSLHQSALSLSSQKSALPVKCHPAVLLTKERRRERLVAPDSRPMRQFMPQLHLTLRTFAAVSVIKIFVPHLSGERRPRDYPLRGLG